MNGDGVKVLAKGFAAVLTGGCCVVVGGFLGYFYHGHQIKNAKAPGGMPQMPAFVRAEEVKLLPYNPTEKFVGHVEAEQHVDIRARVSGHLKEVAFAEGAQVKEGDLLFRIDDEEYRAKVAQRKAEIAQAEAIVARTEKQLKRMEEADPRSISPLDLDNAHADDASARAVLAQAKANLTVAEIDLKHTSIYAPFTGRMGRKFASKGDYITPSFGSLAKIVQTDPMRVTFPMTDRQYLDFAQEAQQMGENSVLRQRIVLPNGSEYPEQGHIEFADNEMSAQTATIQVRLSFPNPKGLLVPNTFVSLLTDLKKPESLPSVPKTAVLITSSAKIVWRLDADNKAEPVPVEIIGSVGAMSAVKGNLKAGDRIVTEGIHKIRPGATVQLAQ